MDNLDSYWLEPRYSPQVAAVISANWTNGSEPGVSVETQLVLEILMLLMCLGAVTGNILVIGIVAATKTFHSVASVLIMNLAVSDLLVGIGVMPFVALSIMNRGWVACTDLCLYVGYTSSVYCTSSVLTVAAIALDRYYSIMDCLRYSSRCTLWRICAVVLWIWLQALATSCPPLLGWSSVSYVPPMYICAVNWASSPSYTAFMAALSYLIPAVVILFCYVNIVKVARSHARRIHTLEDSVQRCRNLNSDCAPGDSPDQHSGCLHSPSTLIYHISGQFVSHVGTEEEDYMNSALPEATTEQRRSASSRFFSFLAQSASQFPLQNSQQNQNHQGVVRLFMVIAAFFLCWTPYISVVLVQATETAISGQSTLVPNSAVTFSYWLLLLNSDINPLLYALLSKRFQSALQGLRQKISARLGSVVGRGDEVRAEGDDGRRWQDPTTLTSAHRGLASSSDSSKSPIFTVSTDFKHQPEEHLCSVCHPQKSSPAWQDAGGDRRVDCLQVSTQPQEGSRISFSGVTEERQPTFFYGQITVRVAHDIS